jgi:2-oxoglutarate dehydrogenase complex dehydrogenase (E1) component-like enzyme
MTNQNVHDYSGDVPIHSSASNRIAYKNGKQLMIDIAPNSCHLESINPILLGSVRAKLDQSSKPTSEILPILIHGDASVTGQGVVFETQILEQLKNYSVGGAVHILLNNYIGNEN